MPIKLANTFVDFQCCRFLRKLKITPPIIQKVVWQKFENQKSEMYKIFIFSRRTSWNVTFFLETLFKGSKSSSKMVEIEKFENSKNLSKRFAKIRALKWIFFLLSGSVLKTLSSRSFCTPHFWSCASGKWINFMIAKWLLWSFWDQKWSSSPCIDLVQGIKIP